MKKNMESTHAQSTEERIWNSAKQVFLEKGFDGTTTRDIAEAAGINIALTNYYFRSKEKLFINIFGEMLQLFFAGMVDIMNKPISLRDKIVELIEHDFQLCKDNPSLSIFIMNEVHRDPDRIVNCIGVLKQVHQSMLEKQVEEEVERGVIRPIKVMHLMPIIIANVQFLFISKNMHMKMWQMDEAGFDTYIENHKQVVIDMIMSYLYDFKKA